MPEYLVAPEAALAMWDDPGTHLSDSIKSDSVAGKHRLNQTKARLNSINKTMQISGYWEPSKHGSGRWLATQVPVEGVELRISAVVTIHRITFYAMWRSERVYPHWRQLPDRFTPKHAQALYREVAHTKGLSAPAIPKPGVPDWIHQARATKAKQPYRAEYPLVPPLANIPGVHPNLPPPALYRRPPPYFPFQER